ncbi:hypothetical protein BDB00DRAFT_819148 [Zychaea mexicana]|uniref:uncharacterized protein n=1 Tax=Zychaea mexicana TaxID=64656 RepID=UPI0022FE8B98|nr:uncharacterized protein BDB00DRAFT_819148 [Zychaea mexicana]KAI9494434.1 hypothetical protein BDB00DRAFT_819148 [Zychaea mexicana]
MFNSRNRPKGQGQPFSLKSDSVPKDAKDSLSQMFDRNTPTSTSTRSSSRIQQRRESLEKADTSNKSSSQHIDVPRKRGRANNNYKTAKSKVATTRTAHEDDDFQEQPRVPQGNNKMQQKRHRTNAKGKGRLENKEEQPEEEVAVVPKLMLFTSKRKVNGAPSTTADKKQREEDQRKKQQEIAELSFSSQIDEEDSNDEEEESKVECPFCHTKLCTRKKLPESIRLALKIVKRKDKKYVKEETERIKQRASAKHQQFLEKRLHVQRKASNMEQYSFCRLHRVELVIKPDGARKEYPLDIDFDSLEGRIHEMKKELALVVNGKVESQFRELALKSYEEDGVNKARSTMAVMSRFDKTLPGYYGSKGAAIILEVLNAMFLHSGELTVKQTQPQLPLEYVQQVLVPEAGLRLILKDLQTKQKEKQKQQKRQTQKGDQDIKSLFERQKEGGGDPSPANDDIVDMAKAMQVMTESTEFGCLVYPANTEDVGEFAEENFVDLTSSDDEDDDSLLDSSSSSEDDK